MLFVCTFPSFFSALVAFFLGVVCRALRIGSDWGLAAQGFCWVGGLFEGSVMRARSVNLINKRPLLFWVLDGDPIILGIQSLGFLSQVSQ